MAFSADSEYKTGGSSSKTVMGHWPIESSNLSLSATPSRLSTFGVEGSWSVYRRILGHTTYVVVMHHVHLDKGDLGKDFDERSPF